MKSKLKIYKSIFTNEFNPVVRTLIISDILVLSAFGLIAPIFAVFITDNITDGTVEVVGVATMVYFLTRSLGQLPVGFILDKVKGEIDDYKALLIGSILTSFVPLFYLLVTESWHLYIVQFIYGFCQALTYPSWYALFTRHIDKNREGFEWSIYTMFTDLGGAAVAGLGGYLAYSYGFAPLFVVVSIFSFTGSLYLLNIKKHVK